MASEETMIRVMRVLAGRMDAAADLDIPKLGEALGLTSLQQLALLNDLNGEFGTNVTPEQAESVAGEAGGLLRLLEAG